MLIMGNRDFFSVMIQLCERGALDKLLQLFVFSRGLPYVKLQTLRISLFQKSWSRYQAGSGLPRELLYVD